MERILVRKAEEADFAQIDRLQNDAFPGDVLLMSAEHMSQRCQGAIKGAVLVATIEEKVVGYCVLTDRPFRPWTGWDFLAVDPEFSRLGIATKLTEEVMKSANRFLIRGFVRSKNSGALNHYRNSGFFQTGRKKEFYSDGDDAIVLLGQRVLPMHLLSKFISKKNSLIAS
jgi:ribosomal protein S18 acetylase RimI-like enzyme